MNKKNTNNNKILIALIAVLAVVLIAVVAIIAGSGSSKPSVDNTTTSQSSQSGNDEISATDSQVANVPEPLEITDTERTNVKVEMADGQTFSICVYPDVAPQSAQNFLNLVREGFYDGLTFHRVIEGFMAQGGDPEGTGMGGSDRNIVGEFSANGHENTLSHKRGVVSMARSNDFNSASSQFFICYDDASFLDGQYAAFGEVTEGMEVVDTFLSAGTDENDKPLKDVVIAKMTVVE